MSYKVFGISDTHYWHTNIIKYCNRPFASIDIMTETLVNNINGVVGENDFLIHCGDFAFFDGNLLRLEELRHSHICKNILLCLGNHDIMHKAVLDKLFTIIPPMFTWNGYMFNHYPIMKIKGVGPRDAALSFVENGGKYYHGHVHNTSDSPFNLSVENIGYTPKLLWES